jgi:hypothetical protein
LVNACQFLIEHVGGRASQSGCAPGCCAVAVWLVPVGTAQHRWCGGHVSRV